MFDAFEEGESFTASNLLVSLSDMEAWDQSIAFYTYAMTDVRNVVILIYCFVQWIISFVVENVYENPETARRGNPLLAIRMLFSTASAIIIHFLVIPEFNTLNNFTHDLRSF